VGASYSSSSSALVAADAVDASSSSSSSSSSPCQHRVSHIVGNVWEAPEAGAEHQELYRVRWKKRGRPPKMGLEAVSAQVTEYELMRRANIAKNATELARLGIGLPQPKAKRSHKESGTEGQTEGKRKIQRVSES